jgi:hypothetical protein
MEVVGQVGRGMRQAPGSWPGSFALAAVTDHAIVQKELMTAGDSRRIVPACAACIDIRGGRGFPCVMLVVMSVRRMPMVACPLSPCSFVAVRMLARSLIGEPRAPPAGAMPQAEQATGQKS